MSVSEETPAIQRADFLAMLAQSIVDTRQAATHMGLLLVDITNLGRINHGHGFGMGDRILCTAHQELLTLSKLPNTVFRVSSHCFAFLLPQLDNPALIALAINRVTTSLRSEILIKCGGVSIDLNVGVTVNHAGSDNSDEMLAAAESSLTHVKLGGDHQLEQLLVAREAEPDNLLIEHELARALQENDFELYYQPKINLQNNTVYGAEALLRWQMPNGQQVSPELVVQMAEGMGRSFALTKWIVHQVMRQQKQWQSSLDINVALNVQAELVSSPDLVPLLSDAAAIWGSDPSRITVEITENAIIEDKEAGFNNLKKIRDSGMNLSIDDFGTGYSSLSYFQHIPATELKIDKSFVESLSENSQDLELIKIMVKIARKFKMSVVAEGVEDERTLDILREIGCNYAQGYHFSKPIPAREFEQWVAAWPH